VVQEQYSGPQYGKPNYFWPPVYNPDRG